MKPVHVVPVNDRREHALDGIFCPCMPSAMHGGAIIRHNSYDGREVGEVCRRALDELGKALADHRHKWSQELRDHYEHAIHLLNVHYPVK